MDLSVPSILRFPDWNLLGLILIDYRSGHWILNKTSLPVNFNELVTSQIIEQLNNLKIENLMFFMGRGW